MATYSDLKPGYYYLIKEHQNSAIELVYVPMETHQCILVEYQDADQNMNWMKKTDSLYELIEQLTDEQAMVFESLFDDENSAEDPDWMNDTNEDEEWFSPGFDDDEDEEKRRAMNN